MARSTIWALAFTLLLTLYTTPVLSQSRTCYALDGTEYPDHVPCTDGETTNCCGPNNICLSNGLCFLQESAGLVLGRLTCTDKDWGSGCYAPCRDYFTNGGSPIVPLHYNRMDSDYCCGSTAIVNGKLGCENGDSPISLPIAEVIIGVAGLSGLSRTTSATSLPTSSAAPTTTASAQPTPSCTGSPAAECPASKSHETTIGAAVGVPLGVIAAAALAWALMERKGKMEAISASAGNAGNTSAYGGFELDNKERHLAELGVKHPPSELVG
ncbi:hypothetical protein FQN53_007612 [Emmonsiellopsis sp. PD_33]|nr:hypothetical protein FQN53_007612 [Emmonsiellopsis sp. PD_33]